MTTALLATLVGILGVLIAATATGALLSRRAAPEAQATIRNLEARTRSWWVMVAVLGGAIVLGPVATVILFALLSFIALREFWTLAPTSPGDHRALFLSFFVVLPLHYALLGNFAYGIFVVLIPVYGFVILPAISTLAGDSRDFLARSAKVQWGLMLCVYAISHAPALLMLETGVPAAQLLVYLVIVAQISDVFQYVVGKLFGRRKLSPSISPSKTVEGLFGGGFLAILTGVLLAPLTPFSYGAAALIATAVVVAGFFGGFVLSAVKRDLGAKDWGDLIEGHGGVLDRVDSLAFAAPVFFHLTRYFYVP